jgi:hypothetical protein
VVVVKALPPYPQKIFCSVPTNFCLANGPIKVGLKMVFRYDKHAEVDMMAGVE